MKLEEALAIARTTGKRFKRPSCGLWFSKGLDQEMFWDDWELEESKIEITETQFDKALESQGWSQQHAITLKKILGFK